MFLISISMDCITISKKTVIEVCCQLLKPILHSKSNGLIRGYPTLVSIGVFLG